MRKIIHKLLIFVYILRIVKTSRRKNFTGLRISKIHTTSTKSVLRTFKSLLVISIGRKVRLLGTFRLRLSLDILNLDILQTLHAITERIDSKTIGISLSGVSEILLLARPKFSNTSFTLIGILDSLDLGPFGFNLLNLRGEFLRKSIRFSGRTNELKEAVRILDTFSLCDSLQTLGISILSLCLNIFSLNTLHCGLTKRRGTCHNVRHRVILVRTLRGDGTTFGLRNITLGGTHRLDNRAFNKGIHASGLHSGTLGGRRFKTIPSPLGIIFRTLILGLGIFTSLCDLKIIHLFLPLTILTIKRTGRYSRTRRSGTTKGGTNSCENCTNTCHNYVGSASFNFCFFFAAMRREIVAASPSDFSKRSRPNSDDGSTSKTSSSS